MHVFKMLAPHSSESSHPEEETTLLTDSTLYSQRKHHYPRIFQRPLPQKPIGDPSEFASHLLLAAIWVTWLSILITQPETFGPDKQENYYTPEKL